MTLAAGENLVLTMAAALFPPKRSRDDDVCCCLLLLLVATMLFCRHAMSSRILPCLLILHWLVGFHEGDAWIFPGTSARGVPNLRVIQRQGTSRTLRRLNPPWDTTTSIYWSRRNEDVSSTKPSSTSLPPTETPSFYSDDCFGLIFLSTGLVVQDVDFCVVFLVASALAATFTLQTRNQSSFVPVTAEQLPGIVALVALLIHAAMHMWNLSLVDVYLQISGSDSIVPTQPLPWAATWEAAVCLFSAAYHLLPRPR